MNLYCAQHRCNHRMTAGQVERVVYALQGALADAMCDGDIDGRDEQTELDSMCPLQAHREARDLEMYAEHVDAMVESRRGGHH